ncbi:MAG: hypothetical protein KJO56_11755 [Gammaproteobacteria bacterium]|nr:hypothetical protein [Gammaproteobacteria bacterium]MBT8104923.1 hypothetical protein [Gammaproteobacteria bacterium]NNK24937.1 hypothetical protein [Woeseiaceae bacterium]
MDGSTAVTATDTEQRAETERRNFTWRTVAYGFAFSRRHAHRRGEDHEVIFLDWHHPWLFFLATGTMLLSCADAFLTLRLLDLGMIEANPVMQSLMDRGTATFTSIKLGMTGMGILVLVFLAKARFMNRFRTGLFLTTFFSGYAVLVCYELVNLFSLL